MSERQAKAQPNIRELEAVMDRAVLLGRGHDLDVRLALGTTIRPAALMAIPKGSTISQSITTAIESLDDCVRSHIRRALNTCQGRVEGPFGAARLLGVNPNTLRSKMKKLGIHPKSFVGKPSSSKAS